MPRYRLRRYDAAGHVVADTTVEAGSTREALEDAYPPPTGERLTAQLVLPGPDHHEEEL